MDDEIIVDEKIYREQKTIENCTVAEYLDYLQAFCDFCSEEITNG